MISASHRRPASLLHCKYHWQRKVRFGRNFPRVFKNGSQLTSILSYHFYPIDCQCNNLLRSFVNTISRCAGEINCRGERYTFWHHRLPEMSCQPDAFLPGSTPVQSHLQECTLPYQFLINSKSVLMPRKLTSISLNQSSILKNFIF